MTEHYRITAAALPGVLAEIARLTSVEAAIAVARRLGGRKLYISIDPKPRHPLIRVLGWQAGRLVCQHIGGDTLEMPFARAQIRKFDAVNLRMRGWSVRRIAEHLNISISRAEELVRGVPKGSDERAELQSTSKLGTCPVCGHRARPKAERESLGQLELFP